MAEIISIVIGFIMPILVELVKKIVNTDKRWLKYVISFGSCIIAGTVTTVLVDGIDFKDLTILLENIGLVFAASQTLYNLYFKESFIQLKIAGEEKK